MRSRQRIRRVWVVSGIGIVLIVSALIYANSHWSWTWTGFNKTLWDWMQLLIIPVILAVGAFVFNLAQSRTQQIAAQRYQNDQDIAINKQREDLLQTYFDRMSELLLNKDLRSSQPDAEVRNVARARTLTILPQLDAQRKGSLVQFLSESKLVEIISLSNANLNHAELHGANLHGAKLYGARLSFANLNHAELGGAKLSFANLSEAILSGANLKNANLNHANLKRANLKNANLSEANLSEANLYGADLSEADLRSANLSNVSLSNADLRSADLRSADLHHAELGGANLHGANLHGANLNHANLHGADLHGANLHGANITREQLDTAKVK